MKESLILALDLGTQSARAILIDNKGNIIAKEKREYNPVYLPSKEGHCEQNPDTYFEYLSSATKAISEKYQDKLKDVIGVVLTTFRDTAVFLDEDYKVL